MNKDNGLSETAGGSSVGLALTCRYKLYPWSSRRGEPTRRLSHSLSWIFFPIFPRFPSCLQSLRGSLTPFAFMGPAMPIPVGPVRQAAAIPVRRGQVCLVSSRMGKRWVIPKGYLEPGKTAAEIALQEAWEEAGLVGILKPVPVGSYFYEKAGRQYHVLVFLMQVTQVAEDWPERSVRDRNWYTFNQASLQVSEYGLQELIRRADPGTDVMG